MHNFYISVHRKSHKHTKDGTKCVCTCVVVCVYMSTCDITYDIIGHTGVGAPRPIRALFSLDGSSGKEQGARGNAMPEERRPRQIAVMN